MSPFRAMMEEIARTAGTRFLDITCRNAPAPLSRAPRIMHNPKWTIRRFSWTRRLLATMTLPPPLVPPEARCGLLPHHSTSLSACGV
jgi:hypothetical protein